MLSRLLKICLKTDELKLCKEMNRTIDPAAITLGKTTRDRRFIDNTNCLSKNRLAVRIDVRNNLSGETSASASVLLAQDEQGALQSRGSYTFNLPNASAN